MKIEGLNFSYKKKEIFKDLNISFIRNTVNVIIGPNGVGKSTLLDLITGVDNYSNNTIIDKPPLERIVYQMQGISFLNTLRGEDIIDFFLNTGVSKNQIVSKKNDIYSDSVIYGIKNTKVRDMSVGERRILIISCICILDRDLYVFDEPTSGVDPTNSKIILNKIEEVSKKAYVVLTTHELEYLNDIDCVINFISNKQSVFSGTYQDFLDISDTKDYKVSFETLAGKPYLS